MDRKKYRCRHCRRLLPMRRSDQSSRYCNKRECQNAKKTAWNRKMLAGDVQYEQDQKEANGIWLKNNPGYWKEYRASHPDYTKRNREQQKKRNQKIKKELAGQESKRVIAKSNQGEPEKRFISGKYQLVPLSDDNDELIAKIDAIVVEINEISST